MHESTQVVCHKRGPGTHPQSNLPSPQEIETGEDEGSVKARKQHDTLGERRQCASRVPRSAVLNARLGCLLQSQFWGFSSPKAECKHCKGPVQLKVMVTVMVQVIGEVKVKVKGMVSEQANTEVRVRVEVKVKVR